MFNMLMCLLRAAEAKGSEALSQQLKEMLKQWMSFMQFAHQSKLVITHDSFIGILGVITSIWDLRTLWNNVMSAQAKPKSALLAAPEKIDVKTAETRTEAPASAQR